MQIALSPLHISLPLLKCMSAYLSQFLCRTLKQRWCAAVISRTLWYNSGAAVFVVYARVCVCYASVCVGCMWQMWDILEKSDTTPTGDRIQKESSAELHNHNLADHCQKKSQSCCNAFSVSRSLSVHISTAVLWSFLHHDAWHIARNIAYEEIAAVYLNHLITVKTCYTESFVHLQHAIPSLHLWLPDGNAAICYTHPPARCWCPRRVLSPHKQFCFLSAFASIANAQLPQLFLLGGVVRWWGYTVYFLSGPPACSPYAQTHTHTHTHKYTCKDKQADHYKINKTMHVLIRVQLCHPSPSVCHTLFIYHFWVVKSRRLRSINVLNWLN